MCQGPGWVPCPAAQPSPGPAASPPRLCLHPVLLSRPRNTESSRTSCCSRWLQRITPSSPTIHSGPGSSLWSGSVRMRGQAHQELGEGWGGLFLLAPPGILLLWLPGQPQASLLGCQTPAVGKALRGTPELKLLVNSQVFFCP